MAPTHLLLLKRIATAEDLAEIDPEYMRQLHAWTAQEMRSGRLTNGEKQEFVKHVAVAASNALGRLDALSKGTYEFHQQPPPCILQTLALLSLCFTSNCGTTESLSTLISSEETTNSETLRSQILNSGDVQGVILGTVSLCLL